MHSSYGCKSVSEKRVRYLGLSLDKARDGNSLCIFIAGHLVVCRDESLDIWSVDPRKSSTRAFLICFLVTSRFRFACDSVCLPRLPILSSSFSTPEVFTTTTTTTIMAERSDSENLLRIKTDTKDLARQQREIQQKIDAIKVRIDKEGPTAFLEACMDREAERQKSICIRSDIALTIIGASIEDLTRDSQDPPSVVAVRKLMNSMEDLDNEVSFEIVNSVLVIQTQNSAESLADVFEDPQSASGSASKSSSLRTTRILQETQLAVRELATQPVTRYVARLDADHLARRLEEQREQHNTIASTINLPTIQVNRVKDRPSQVLSRSTQVSQGCQEKSQSLDTQDSYGYLDILLTQTPQSRILEALQNLDCNHGSESDRHQTEMEDQERSDTLDATVRKVLEGTELAKLKDVAANLQINAKELKDCIQALEDRPEVQDGECRGVAGEETGGLLQTSMSLNSNKRPSASEDKTNVKRSRA